jgi:hypothetical protein
MLVVAVSRTHQVQSICLKQRISSVNCNWISTQLHRFRV